MTDKIPVSVFLVTLNEGRHLNEVLRALTRFDEVIIVDSGSTDETLTIANTYGIAPVHQDWLGFARQKNFALSLCSHEWVLNIDGDEVLTEQTVQHISQLIAKPTYDAYRLYFDDLFWDKSMAAASGKRSIVRLFRKDQAQYPLNRKVHENLVLPKGCKVGSLRGLVKHYGYGTTELLMTKQNKYSSLKALEKFEKGKKPSLLKLTLVFPLTFVKSYLLKRMFLSGIRGLVHAHIDATYAFLKEAKLFELHYKKNRAL